MYAALINLALFTVVTCVTAIDAITISHRGGRKTCTVKALGNGIDDTQSILQAFEQCGNNARVVFPETENYWIGTKMNP